MNIEIITTEDLRNFKQDVLNTIKEMLKVDDGNNPEWIKAKEVKTLLSVSDNTLRQLRIEGKLSRILMGRSYYYNKQEVQNLFTERRSNV